MFNSLLIALLSTLIATALGMLMALALVRHPFRGRAATNLLIFLPMSTPEIVLGTSLLTLFIASVEWPCPGEFFPVEHHDDPDRARDVQHQLRGRDGARPAAGFPRHLEEAARDLYANEWTTFWRVTFPLILPGMIAAALLAFSLSIDDYVITAFTSGGSETFPLYIYGAQQRGIPVQVNVIGTIIFLTAVGLVLLTTICQRPSRRRDYREPEHDDDRHAGSTTDGRRRSIPCPTASSCPRSGRATRT